MNLRAVALAGFVAALGVWAVGARPAAEQRALAQQEFGRLREERERLRLRLAALERKEAAHARLVGASAAGSRDPVKALRRFVVDAVSKAPLSDVRLEVSSGRGLTAARVRLSGAGTFREVLELTERLLGPDSGLALEGLQLTGGTRGVRVEVEGFTLGAPSS